jgi:hypothetical protein
MDESFDIYEDIPSEKKGEDDLYGDLPTQKQAFQVLVLTFLCLLQQDNTASPEREQRESTPDEETDSSYRNRSSHSFQSSKT